jgi:ADP-ribosylglycohydrolase
VPDLGIQAANGRRKSTRQQFVGCLLGGAVGDALGAPVEFLPFADIRRQWGPHGVTRIGAPKRPAASTRGIEPGRITDDTQMTLFTAEGLLRSHNRWRERGIVNPTELVYRAYLRWLVTQGMDAPGLTDLDRDSWLLREPRLFQQRAPGHTCLGALASGRAGTLETPINNSKGCGGVMRVAPAGLACADAFSAGCELAALTHGHPSGYLAAGFLAAVIARCRKGQLLTSAIVRASTELRRHARHKETLAAVQAAVELARAGDATPARVESLGAGWVAEEALSIALYCALAARGFADGVLAAVNHSGDSDSTGALTGNILGVMHGADSIPDAWLARLELREVIETVGDDLFRHFGSQSRRPVEDANRYPPW